MQGNKSAKSAIESMLFVWGEPLDIKDMADALGLGRQETYECCKELQDEYEREGRGIVIREINKSFQYVTRGSNLTYIQRLCTPVKHRKLSQSALETLAIIAYKQPVTKGEIEAIRGIRCDRVIDGLAGKGLVGEVGRSDSVGRPVLYGTTDDFLRYFGFQSLKELPKFEDIERALREDGDIDGIIDEIDAAGYETGNRDIVEGQISFEELSDQ